MRVVLNIGRYTSLPLDSIQAIEKRTGAWAFLSSLWKAISLIIVCMIEQEEFPGWPSPGYKVWLSNGKTIHFTEEEKAAYDERIEWHSVTMEWYGMVKALGFRG